MPAMSTLEPFSISPPPDRPRHAHQEIADLLATALLRQRACPLPDSHQNSECVRLGFSGQQRVNANPDHYNGVCP
jgi:hypothetical protein